MADERSHVGLELFERDLQAINEIRFGLTSRITVTHGVLCDRDWDLDKVGMWSARESSHLDFFPSASGIVTSISVCTHSFRLNFEFNFFLPVSDNESKL